MNILPRTVRALSARHNGRANLSSLPAEVVVFADNNTAVCWHPEQPFPYECSKPLPEEKCCGANTVLKIGEEEVSQVFRTKKPDMVVEELARVTYTTKHRWYPRSRDKKAKETEPDRKYL